ncbi:MAG: diacylglycerol kinase family lipid kinase [Elusimicrobia bacterium]|nr:diacylglycerol kinase family lipid kinase [Elusimicrobiota bacterium]
MAAPIRLYRRAAAQAMKTLFIVNPAAGHGRGAARWKTASALALAKHPHSEAWTTERPGHGAELARKGIAAGFRSIVAVGGDGTLGEVVDGWLSLERRPEDAAIGTWPVGSGCDFARHFGITADAEQLLRALERRNVRTLDAGKVTFAAFGGGTGTRFFLNIAAFGLAGDVAERTHRKGKPWGGTLTYMLDSLAALLSATPRRMELVLDGAAQPSGLYHLVALANTSMSGGGMRIAPGADASDGRLDLVTVGPLSRLQLFRRFPLIYSGKHVGTEGIELRTVRRLEARADGPAPLNIDGDLVGSLPAAFEILPKAIPFLCP